MSKLSHPLLLPSFVAGLLIYCVLACAGPSEPGEDASMDMAGEVTTDVRVPETPVQARRCVAEDEVFAALANRPTERWLRGSSSLIARGGEPAHALRDLLSTRSGRAELIGVTSYGIGLHPGGELAELYIHDCTQGFELMSRTLIGSDGRARFIINEEDLPFHGVYSIAMRLPGDGSLAPGTWRILPAGTQLVVMDIDGVASAEALSPFGQKWRELFGSIGAGDRVPRPREAIDRMTQVRAEQGYEILYLTARPPSLTDESRSWLEAHALAPGTLWFDDREQAFRSPSQYIAYKSSVLARMRASGYVLPVAYGAREEDQRCFDVSSVDEVYMVGSDVDRSVSLGSGFEEHVETIALDPGISQPFFFLE